jgi:hypothetical protein
VSARQVEAGHKTGGPGCPRLRQSELIVPVERAQRGDRGALERVVGAIQDDVFHLALRMLGDPDDARDACQVEICSAYAVTATGEPLLVGRPDLEEEVDDRPDSTRPP